MTLPPSFDKEYKLPLTSTIRKYETKEEAYEAHKKRVTEYNKANKEAHIARVLKYGRKPEVIEHRRIQANLRNSLRSPEEKKEINRRAYERLKAKKLAKEQECQTDTQPNNS